MLSASKIRETAIHESGHAICGIAMGLTIYKVVLCLKGNGDRAGYCGFSDHVLVFNNLVMLVGGVIAEQLFCPHPGATLQAGDADRAKSVWEKLYRGQEFRLDLPLIKVAESRARNILQEREEEVRVLAALLRDWLELSGQDIQVITTKIRSDRILRQLAAARARFDRAERNRRHE